VPKITAVVLVGFRRSAFSTNHRDTSLAQLSMVEVADVALDWLRSFVTECTQQIAVGSEKSAVFECASGVPQGSVLGPMIFGMYVSPVGDVVSQHSVWVYVFIGSAVDVKVVQHTSWASRG